MEANLCEIRRRQGRDRTSKSRCRRRLDWTPQIADKRETTGDGPRPKPADSPGKSCRLGQRLCIWAGGGGVHRFVRTRLRCRIPVNREVFRVFRRSRDAVPEQTGSEREVGRHFLPLRPADSTNRNREANREGAGNDQGREQGASVGADGWIVDAKQARVAGLRACFGASVERARGCPSLGYKRAATGCERPVPRSSILDSLGLKEGGTSSPAHVP